MRLDYRTLAWCRFLLLVCLLLGVAGCGGPKGLDVPLFPVTGKITVDGKEMTFGTVSFHPDKTKGNQSTIQSSGLIKDGTYKMRTSGKDGAPAGWYKVTVSTNSPTGKTPSDVLIPNQKYQSKAYTDLLIEVRENAPVEAYDLKLEK